ncbi:glucosidase [Hymenobacter sp. M29]|uniref:Glucosidase n=1 Tax=Hymenobacter mellowenesis TaxID=3063995 RepID=A0ABT9A7P5_9BACT|nr:glucosidase [Hymenobacter sp. M29]MDO7845858.1 glucosidase [Hymenobacter sp. M29]
MQEQTRLAEARTKNAPWKQFGPYLTERQWGTVREDYSAHGDAWNYISHDMARAYAYRWGEEGLGGISDDQQRLCFAVGLWNGRDNQLKERLFGLTNPEGNHGEDVKEQYYYLDSTPTHSYMRMLYKYPQAAFPYDELRAQNAQRTRLEPEFELIDTGIFAESRYFDVFIEYAKAGPQDLLIQLTIHNRGPEAAPLTVLPQLWFRNTWTLGYDDHRPDIRRAGPAGLVAEHRDLGAYQLYCDQPAELLFCENETSPTVFGKKRKKKNKAGRYFKDGINEYVVNGQATAVNPQEHGTKAAARYQLTIEPGQPQTVRLRLSQPAHDTPFADFDPLFQARRQDADEFYACIQEGLASADARNVQRQAFAGMLWSKQYYYYDVNQWLDGDPGRPVPPAKRLTGRNHTWRHLHNADIISMPDKWEYPWYAAWDLAFHCLPLAMVDSTFAKHQLRLLCQDGYLHPNGQMPAYEWHFSDVNAPVHAWATWRVYQMDRKLHGQPDTEFLEAVFQKLVMTFTWWVNRKDRDERNIFEGGFLGMDNIGVFDRSAPLPTGGKIEQSDGTSWMAMFALNLMRMALELAQTRPVYQEMATKFFEHFLHIAEAMTRGGGGKFNLWDEQDQFYYDVLHAPDDTRTRLRIRSMVGLIPLFAVEVIDDELLATVPEFYARALALIQRRPLLAELVSRWQEPGHSTRHLMGLMRRSRLRHVLTRMLDETEFLSDYGIRSLSRYHFDNPYWYHLGEKDSFSVGYVAGEAESDMFGGNSNWRGPVWFPVNYLIIESLQRFHSYYGDGFTIEYPTGSGQQHTLAQVADALSARLARLFLKDENGRRPAHGTTEIHQTDEHFRDHLLFHEYFHGDDGHGLGASHQTGWTGLVVRLLQKPQ